jgi:hypothetical protein
MAVALVASGSFFVGLLVVGLTWVLVSPPSYWVAVQWMLFAACATLFLVGAVALLASTTRTIILGLPRVRVTEVGFWIGDHRVLWANVAWVVRAQAIGLRWLVIETDLHSIRSLARYDRVALRSMPRYRDDSKPLWVADQQLEQGVDDALARVPAELLRQ